MNPFKRFSLVLLLLLIQMSVLANAHDQPIKLAIFDDPQIANNDNNTLAQSLEKAYLRGIQTAIQIAGKEDYQVKQKAFFYNKNLLAVFQEVPRVKRWNPDFIVGLHTSNEALMSQSMFSNLLVLSITATDKKLMHLSPNFHTLGVPDPYISKALVQYVGERFPQKNLFIMVGVESKESLDFGHAIAKAYKQHYPNHTVVIKEFLTNDLLSMSPKSLLKGYHKNDVILMFSIAGTYHSQLMLMNKLARYLAPNRPTFITTVDNWNNDTAPNSSTLTSPSYHAYHITNLYVNSKTPLYKEFSQAYQAIYHTQPNYIISYFTYRAVMSVITALSQYPPPKNLPLKEAILWSYHQALAYHPNWFRPKTLGVYKILPPKEVFVGTIPLANDHET